MSITFPTTDLKVPSGITAMPSEMKRPGFGTLYGFDAQGGGGAAAWTNTYSAKMDATNEHLIPDGGTITLGTSDLAMSIWFKQNATAFAYLVVDGSLSGRMYANANALIKHGAWGFSSIASAISPGNWQHLFLTRDSGTQKLYVDGVLKNTYTVSTSFTIARFGAYSSAGSYYLDGNMDEIALWDSGQDSNVAAIYNSGTPADLTALSPTHWWRMGDNDGGAGTTVTDVGDGGTDLTLVNGAAFASDVP